MAKQNLLPKLFEPLAIAILLALFKYLPLLLLTYLQLHRN